MSSFFSNLLVGIASSFCISMVLFCTGMPVAHAQVQSSNQQYDEYWQQSTADDFAHWTLNGVAAHGGAAQVMLRLAPGSNLACNAVDIDNGSASYDTTAGLCAGTDPQAPGSYDNGINYYNGGSFFYGTLVSPVHTTQKPITTIVASWNATTPPGTWMEVHVRVQQKGTWTHWYILPIWASDFSTIHRHSVDGQSDSTGAVATDTFYTQGQKATAYQLSVTLFSTTPTNSPEVSSISAIATNDVDAQHTPVVPSNQAAWGTNLPVPQRSQMLSQYQGLGYGGGGEVWCSPTSTSMVMAYWSNVLNRPDLTQTVPDAARDTYDFTYEGTGNWPFNTAYAASYGLHAFVTRMYSMSQVEQWIKAGVPIIMSLAYGVGQLPGSPIPSTDGHLMVIRGFTSTGDVITNDPAAATDDAVQIVYPRDILQKLWLDSSNGTVYVVYPENWPTPTIDSLGSW
ncbi:MAG TPA: peptidase C39 family protein [Ktedonobacteraceae bacterium]